MPWSDISSGISDAASSVGDALGSAGSSILNAAESLPWQQILQYGAPLLGGLLGSRASTGAANTQSQSAQQANNQLMQELTKQQGIVAPWTQSGTLALSDLSKFMGLGGPTGAGGNMTAPGVAGFQYNPNADPLTQFMLKSGSEAIANQRSALGGVNSGATLKALSDYGQQTAGTAYQQQFNNWNTELNNLFSRLTGISGTGANTAGSMAGLGLNASGIMGGNTIGAGNAQAAGQVGSANAYTNALQNIFSNPGMYSNNPSSTPTAMNSNPTAMNNPSDIYGFGSNTGFGTTAPMYNYGVTPGTDVYAT